MAREAFPPMGARIVAELTGSETSCQLSTVARCPPSVGVLRRPWQSAAFGLSREMVPYGRLFARCADGPPRRARTMIVACVKLAICPAQGRG